MMTNVVFYETLAIANFTDRARVFTRQLYESPWRTAR